MKENLLKLKQNSAAKAFGWSFLLAVAIFLPLVIYNNGYFLFLGDFNVQQIPFYKMTHEMVKSGNVGWNWYTDLGANFIGSYSFYLLFSPFFWITLLFPNSVVPFLMAPLLVLKTACAALTSYFYIKRFVKDSFWAIVGSMLYAFSGFMTFNIFFNHFHDVVVFFPLLLISLEELVENNRYGFFAAMVAVNCIVNYWFFIGEVVFVIIYFLIRAGAGRWGCTIKKFFIIALEAVLGVGIAMVTLLPSVLALMGNPRTGSDKFINGWIMWIYGFNQRLPAIIQSFFFPPEMPSRPNFFPDMGAKWASLSAWLPLFSCIGVIAFCIAKRKNPHKRLIVTCMIMSLVPVFNSAFVLFNNSYYARWFYMPILIMCVATAVALEEKDRPRMKAGWFSAWKWVLGFVLVFSLGIGFSPKLNADGVATIGLYGNAIGFWLIVFVTLICLAMVAVIIFLRMPKRIFKRVVCVSLSAVIVVFSLGYLISGKGDKGRDDSFIRNSINGANLMPIPTDTFSRTDLYDCSDNMGMYWGVPNIQAFHSIVPASIMEFYPYVGIKRDVSSKPGIEYDALRSLLSVRWLVVPVDIQDNPPADGYNYFDRHLDFNIYEFENYIPMGFAYTVAVSQEDMDKLSGEQKTRHMLTAISLDEKALARASDIIYILDEVDYSAISPEGLEKAIEEKRALACDSFVIDKKGFTATSNLGQSRLMFFSVPYDKGWSATVNGEEVIIEKANVGFMAVRVPAGEAVIRFDYKTPGLKVGAVVSVISLAILVIFVIIVKKKTAQGPKMAVAIEDVPNKVIMEVAEEKPIIGEAVILENTEQEKNELE